MNLSNKRKGWHYESLRHSLASKGIKTQTKGKEPLIISTSQSDIKYLAKNPLKHTKEGKSKYHKDVYKNIDDPEFNIDAMVYHPEETKGKAVIIIDETLPKTKFGKLYNKIIRKETTPTRKEVVLHEKLHLKHPKLSEQRISNLTTQLRKEKLRWWER